MHLCFCGYESKFSNQGNNRISHFIVNSINFLFCFFKITLKDSKRLHQQVWLNEYIKIYIWFEIYLNQKIWQRWRMLPSETRCTTCHHNYSLAIVCMLRVLVRCSQSNDALLSHRRAFAFRIRFRVTLRQRTIVRLQCLQSTHHTKHFNEYIR